MAISPIAGAIYANQVAPQASVIQAEQNAKIDMQNAMAAALANEKEKEVTEVRATEETYHVDPDNEHEKEKNKGQQEREKSNKNENSEQDLSEIEADSLVELETENLDENLENSEEENSSQSRPLKYEHADLLSAKELEARLESLRRAEEAQADDEDKPTFLNLSV